MSARDVIRLIEALPPNELGEVLAFLDSKKHAVAEESSNKRMTFEEAKKHVFTQYGDVLERLAK